MGAGRSIQLARQCSVFETQITCFRDGDLNWIGAGSGENTHLVIKNI